MSSLWHTVFGFYCACVVGGTSTHSDSAFGRFAASAERAAAPAPNAAYARPKRPRRAKPSPGVRAHSLAISRTRDHLETTTSGRSPARSARATGRRARQTRQAGAQLVHAACLSLVQSRLLKLGDLVRLYMGMRTRGLERAPAPSDGAVMGPLGSSDVCSCSGMDEASKPWAQCKSSPQRLPPQLQQLRRSADAVIASAVAPAAQHSPHRAAGRLTLARAQ